MSQLGNFSYKMCMLATPNGINYLMSICTLQFELFQVKLPLQYKGLKTRQQTNSFHTKSCTKLTRGLIKILKHFDRCLFNN